MALALHLRKSGGLSPRRPKTRLRRRRIVAPWSSTPSSQTRSIRPSQTVYVDRTKDEIKNALDVDETMHRDEGYGSRLGSYYHGDQ
jgi:hypothetical protein